MARKSILWSGVVLLGLGMAFAGCGERGEWMKEEAASTEASRGAERAEATEQDQPVTAK